MSTTEKIEQAAAELGRMIADHPASKALADADAQLRKDAQAQRLINDLNQLIRAIGQKQQQQKPIEVEEKRQLETLQKQVARLPQVGRLQMAQMDFLDVLRKVNDIIGRTAQPPVAAEGSEVAGRIRPQA